MLRVTCPCGAPYSLGDHLAGRQFKCPKCGQVLQVGASGGGGAAPPQQRPPQGSPQQGKSGWGKASSESGYGWDSGRQPKQGAPKQKPSGGGGLGFADDDALLNSMDNSREQKQPSKAQIRSSGRNKAMRTSGSGRAAKRSSGSGRAAKRTSGSGRARTSGTGKARGRSSSGRNKPAKPEFTPARGDSSHSRSCPVCEATIAKVAPECPSCGVPLRGPSAMQRLQGSFDWSKLTSAIVPLAVIAAIGFGVKVYSDKNKSPEVAVTPRPRVTETPKPTPSETPKPTPTATASATPTGPVDKNIIIPEGELAGDFKRLRDAGEPRDVREAIQALAEKPGVRAALAIAEQSQNAGYRLKVHRASLLAGDEAARRAYIEASLSRRGDAGLRLLHTVVAALDFDRLAFEETVLALRRTEIAFEWGKLALRGDLPDQAAIYNAVQTADADSRLLLVLAYTFRRDGSYLEDTVDALEYPSETVKALALKGIKELAGDLGPEGDGVDAWREWARSYAPVRELLGKACADYTKPRGWANQTAAARAASAAVKELCGRADELFKYLPVFYKDTVSESMRTGMVLGQILARVGGDHPREAKALLSELTRGDIERRGSGFIVRGALLGLGKEVAGEVSSGISAGSIPLDDQALFPELLEPADRDDVAPFLEVVKSKDDAAHWLALSSMRVPLPELLEWMTTTTLGQRYEVAARLASKKVMKELLGQLKRNEFGAPPLNNSVNVANFLAKTGTHDLANDLAKFAKREPDRYELFDAFGKLGDAGDLSLLRGLAREKELPRKVADRVFRALASVGGQDAGKILDDRIRDDDPVREQALFVLMQLGGDFKGVREIARKPFEAGGAVDAGDIQLLGRVGKRKEQELLWKYCYEGLGENKYGYKLVRAMFVALGRMGYNAEVQEGLAGFLYAGHRFSGVTALCYSLFFHEDRKESEADGVSDALEAALDGAAGKARPADVLVLAALATVDRAKAAGRAVEFGKALRGTAQPALLGGTAFALAAAGTDESEAMLSELACYPADVGRQSVAQGIAYAALAGIVQKAPQALELLRYDRDQLTRAYAALALAELHVSGSARELARAMAMPEPLLDLTPRPYDFMFLIPMFEPLPLRALLWRAAETLLGRSDSKQARYHGNLGHGRIHEIERGLRLELRKKRR